MNKKIITIFVTIALFLVLSLADYLSTKIENNQPQIAPTPEVKSDQTQPTIPQNQEIRHGGVLNKVANVIDGDTVKLDNGQVVRYIGIDTPETVDPRRTAQCYGQEASKKNEELVEGKTVELEKDISETDRYGRLLRYLWIEDTLINEYLVREGYARASSYPPDVKYQDRFREAERLARNEKKGLWSDLCQTDVEIDPQSIKMDKQIVTPTLNIKSNKVNQGVPNTSFTCNCSKTCSQMSCDEAQYQLLTCGCQARDADKDGIACDSNCQ